MFELTHIVIIVKKKPLSMCTELFHCFALEDPSHDLHTRQRNTFSKCQVHKVSIQRFVSVGAFNKCQLYVRTELMISSGKFFNSSSKNVCKDDFRILVIFSCIFHNKNCFPLLELQKRSWITGHFLEAFCMCVMHQNLKQLMTQEKNSKKEEKSLPKRQEVNMI